MSMQDIIRQINLMPLDSKILVVEEVLKSIRKQENNTSMRQAADLLYEDYTNDKELTAFSALDLEDFYETK